MITIDPLNHAQMALLSFGLLLTIGVSFIGGMIAMNDAFDDAASFVPVVPLVAMAFSAGSLLANLIFLITQHI